RYRNVTGVQTCALPIYGVTFLDIMFCSVLAVHKNVIAVSVIKWILVTINHGIKLFSTSCCYIKMSFRFAQLRQFYWNEIPFSVWCRAYTIFTQPGATPLKKIPFFF